MSKTKASGSSKVYSKVCAFCGKEFQTESRQVLYCSLTCRRGKERSRYRQRNAGSPIFYMPDAYMGRVLYFDGLHAANRDLPGRNVDFALGF